MFKLVISFSLVISVIIGIPCAEGAALNANLLVETGAL
jgi:hypothetical protein